jgi:hypothetical protein
MSGMNFGGERDEEGAEAISPRNVKAADLPSV